MDSAGGNGKGEKMFKSALDIKLEQNIERVPF